MAAVVVGFLFSVTWWFLTSLQAQFILSPDQVFSEKGAISKIDYHDRFTQYKKFIVKHLETPRMKELTAYLDANLFPSNSVDDQPNPSTEVHEADEDGDEFSRAFSNSGVQGMSTAMLTVLNVTQTINRILGQHVGYWPLSIR